MSDQFSIGQAAKHIGVSRDTLRRWEKKGKITALRSPSNRRYYTKEQLDHLIEKPKTATQEKIQSEGNKTTPSGSLKLVIYSLAALMAAVFFASLLQIFFFG